MRNKFLSILISIAIIMGMFNNFVFASDVFDNNNSIMNRVNVGVDFNGTDNRSELRHAVFEDWIVEECQEATYKYDEGGLIFRVKNKTAGGKGAIVSTAIKSLLNKNGNGNLLTVDGLRSTSFKNSAITLEIEGLPAGEHTLTTWHSYNWINSSNSTFSVSINGENVETGIKAACKVADDNLATITYNSFEAIEGKPVIVTISVDGTKSNNSTVAVLNAFEIDGVHPLKSIQNAVPKDNEQHHEQENGLTWTPADGAVSHRLYLGSDLYMVENATEEFAEYKGEFEECYYDFSNIEMNHMKTYYWRVDEVYEDGTVVKGKVRSFNISHLAFPTAEGYGRFAKGGRGGKILEVTTLEDGYETIVNEEGKEVRQPIEGSLRWAIESFTEPRIIVFNVGGVIELKSMLMVDGNHGNVYIAGQTAPGDGITLCNNTFGGSGASDLIIRDIKVRVGDSERKGLGGMGLGSCDHSIIDHCSISWSSDEGFSSRNAKNITLQWTIIAEALNYSYHYAPAPDGSSENRDPDARSAHGFAASIGGNKATFHHNLLAHCTARNWSQAGGLESDGSYAGYLDIRYNVVYNWLYRTCEGGARQTQFVSNYYKMGEESRNINIYNVEGDEIGNSYIDPNTGERKGNWQMAYVEGNKMTDKDGIVLLDPLKDDPWSRVTLEGLNMTTPEDCKSDIPFFDSYVKESTADEAYESVLSNVGARSHSRDYLDARYIEETRTGTYTYVGSVEGHKGFIDSQEDVGGYPDESQLEYAERAEDFDTDHDGMPDAWESLHGLDPSNPADGKVITLSAEGYTNVEMYLNELMNDPLVWINENQKPTPTKSPTVTPLATLSPADTPEVTCTAFPEIVLGDVNNDGSIDANDALSVLKHVAKLKILEDNALIAANVNNDGIITANDALEILKYAARLIDSF